MASKETEEAAKAFVEKKRQSRKSELREMYPYLPESDLNDLLEKCYGSMSDEIIKGFPKIKASRDRTSFFSLPRQLRDVIYEYAVDSMDSDGISQVVRVNLGWKVPTIMNTCRQLREEFEPIYYTKARFLVLLSVSPVDSQLARLYSMAKKWLRFIGPKNAARITRLYFKLAGPLDRGLDGVAVQIARKLCEPTAAGSYRAKAQSLLPIDGGKLLRALELERTGIRKSVLSLGMGSDPGHPTECPLFDFTKNADNGD